MSKSKARPISKAKVRPPARPADSARHDPVRIVPLHQPAAVAAPIAAPALTYRGGPLLSAVKVFTIFWGAAWKQPSHTTTIGRLNHFFDFILTSTLIDQLAEYDVPKYPIAHGKR